MAIRRFNWFLILRLAGIVMFIIILTKIDVHQVWEQLKMVRGSVILITMGFVVLQLILKAVRWHLLNKGTENEKQPGRSFGEFFESYAIGIVTPGRLGELLKAGYSTDRRGKLSTGVRVIVERGLDFGLFLCVAGSALAWGNISFQSQTWGLLTISIGLLSILLSISLLRSEKVYKILGRLLSLFKFGDQALDRRMRSFSFTLGIVFISILSNAVYFYSCYFLAVNVSMNAGFLYISGGVAVAGLLNTIPVTVMGLGTRELAFLSIFSNYPAPVIIAFSSLIFLCWQVGSGIISILTGEILITYSNRKGL